jgi:hypothetical protein
MQPVSSSIPPEHKMDAVEEGAGTAALPPIPPAIKKFGEKLKGTLDGDLARCQSYFSNKIDKLVDKGVSKAIDATADNKVDAVITKATTRKSNLAHGVGKVLLGIIAAVVIKATIFWPLVIAGAVIALTSLVIKDPQKREERAILGARVAASPIIMPLALFKAAYEDFQKARKTGEAAQAAKVIKQGVRDVRAEL